MTHIRTELELPEELSTLLDAVVSNDWPTGEYDRDAMEFFYTCFVNNEKDAEGWYSWYAIREADTEAPRTLIGAGGYFGPPDENGNVEIGYSVIPRWQRRGYATDIVQMLVENAFTFDSVKRVIAHTTEGNPASVTVLRRCGFGMIGEGREPGTIRFERDRSTTIEGQI